MAKNQNPTNNYVKKDTLLIVAVVAFALGFLGGVVLTVHKTKGTGGASRTMAQPSSAPPNPGAPTEASTGRALEIFNLEKITAQNPDDVEAWVQLGNLYFDSDNFSKAIEAYKKALALKPNNANVITDLGVMYRRNGQPVEAVKAFDRAMQIDPSHETSRFNKGVVLMHDLKDVDGAIKAWEELLKLNPVALAPGGQSVDELVQKIKNTKK